MGFMDRLFGRRNDAYRQGGYAPTPQGGYAPTGQYPNQYPNTGWSGGVQDRVPQRRSADEEAIARYRYLLETAPPERIEEAHAEAFARLTPEQRRQVLSELARSSGEPVRDDSPRSLARAATRLEMRRPGSLLTTFGDGMGMGYGRGGLGMGGLGMGMGGMGMGSMLLSSVAGAFIGTAIADEIFDHDGFMDWDTGGNDVADGDAFAGFDQGGFGGEQIADGGGDLFGGDFGGGDDFSF